MWGKKPYVKLLKVRSVGIINLLSVRRTKVPDQYSQSFHLITAVRLGSQRDKTIRKAIIRSLLNTEITGRQLPAASLSYSTVISRGLDNSLCAPPSCPVCVMWRRVSPSRAVRSLQTTGCYWRSSSRDGRREDKRVGGNYSVHGRRMWSALKL